MKRLEIIGIDGAKLADPLVDVQGDDFQVSFIVPLYLPTIKISLIELPDEDSERLTAQQRLVKGIISPERGG